MKIRNNNFPRDELNSALEVGYYHTNDAYPFIDSAAWQVKESEEYRLNRRISFVRCNRPWVKKRRKNRRN